MRLKILLSSLALVAVAIGWIAVRSTGTRLDAELEAARDLQRELARLKAENARLRTQAPDTTRVAIAHRSLAEAARLRQEIRQREEAPRPPPFALGDWTPASTWANRGVATPRATLETALWAAAGGDVAALSALLELDPATRAKADDLLAKLPPASRQTFADAEALIASVTLGRIPPAEAQIAWFHATDNDHASAAVLLRGADNLPPASSHPPATSNEIDRPPPMGPDNRSTRMATLSLHRSDSGWRLIVPASAIDRMARDLVAATK